MGAFDELQVARTGLDAKLPWILGGFSGLELMDALTRACAASGQSEVLNQRVQDAAEYWFLEGQCHSA